MNNNIIKNNHYSNYEDDFMDLIASEMLAPEASFQLADPSLVSYYKDYSNRVLWINKDISCTLFNEIKSIIQWNREDEANNIPIEKRKPITCFIDTAGGWLDSAFSFIDIVSKSKTPVKTINIGGCLSAGAIMLLSGTPGYRYCLPLSTALIHEGSGGASGNFSTVQAQSEDYKHTIDTMKKWVMDHTKVDAKTMKKWSGKEVYLYADEQLAYGLVDYIVTDINDII